MVSPSADGNLSWRPDRRVEVGPALLCQAEALEQRGRQVPWHAERAPPKRPKVDPRPSAASAPGYVPFTPGDPWGNVPAVDRSQYPSSESMATDPN